MTILGSASTAGCFFFAEKPATSIDSDWTTPLDTDLRAAAPKLEAAMKARGFQMDLQWIGARGPEYGIERGPLGEPLRKRVLAMYAFRVPSSGKCFLQGDGAFAQHVMLAREHLGGGQYGPPRIIGYDPMNGDGKPVGREVVCDAPAKAKGGAHAPFAGGAGS
jgi:hypothetical protein